ncbi:hypothetical protein J2736_001287 [Paenibacillus qinlingensis]|uniref:CBM-cenC domain-containing protein n=2 Tax=Paenibacillus qinlingensis TaxID=1837343 RepID=A0ABU1NRJ7_9BACL|nr:hypothetical protein [Paenibacillus qinlingensis]
MIIRSILARMVLTCSVIMSTFILITILSSTAQAEGGPVQVGYLLDENFSFLQAKPDATYTASGWDVNQSGGSMTYSYNNYMKLSDTSSTLPVTMYHKFVTQTSGIVVWEFRFKPGAIIDGLQWQLRNDTTAAISISTSSNQFVLNTSSGTQNLQTYSANTEYGIKVVANIDTDKTDVYVNGVLKASAANFNQSVSQLNGMYMQTGAASTGDVYITPIQIYKGYSVNEKFISTMTNVPADWTATNSGGVIAVEQNKSATSPDIYSLKLDGSASTSGVALSKTVSALSDDEIFQFKVLIPTKADGMVFELKSGSSSAVKLTTASGQFNYVNGSGTAVPFYNYKANVWYAFMVKVHPSTDKADIYLNGKLLVSNAAFTTAITSIDTIRFYAPNGANKLMWVDDIGLYKDYPLPGDYVPTPVKVSSPTYQIGVQSCSMWREGTHLGWDAINPYPERTPLLGFYDEGSPETADWEIKWKVEHGVNFENYCWFRPRGNEGLPIKDPYLGSALHDGFFNAKYSDQMNFTIMWENTSSFSSGAADFENNIVPYWIEYYFKDPRYLKIGNKPVLSIYKLDGLIRDFGSLTAAANEISYLRTAVQAAGFTDVILITPTSSSDTTALTNLNTAGFDSIYAYSYGGVNSHINLQEKIMNDQKNTGILDVIPTLSMGRDDFPWLGKSGYWTTVTEFNTLANWVKNTYIPSLPAGSVGKSIIMLDNWNEFGEGHFLMPTGLQGFGYMDTIRNTFTTGGAHTDTVPTLTQKNRINVLYPTDRVVNEVWNKPQLTGNYAKSWEFNTAGNSEGWTDVKQISGLTVAGGSYSGTSTGTDPGIVSGDMLGLDASDASYLDIRMMNSAEGAGVIYFITNSDTNWDEAKSVQFYIGPNGGNQTLYHVPMFENAAWTGTIRQIRFDMMTTTGTFSIDSIRAVDSSGIPVGANQIVDPSFEDTYLHYSGWEITPQLSNAQMHTGTHSLKLTKTNAYGSLNMPLDVVNGQPFYYSAWGKLATGSTSGQVLKLGLQYNLNGVQKQVILTSSAALTTTAWSQAATTYTINESGLVSDIRLLIYTDNPALAEAFYLDDVEVRPDFVMDPGFEDAATHYTGWQISQLLSTAEHHTGAQSVKITKSNGYGSLQVPLPVVKGAAYTYSAWAKLAIGSTPGEYLRLGIQYKLNGVQKQVTMLTSAGLSTSAWTQVQGNYTISETGTVTDVVLLIYTDNPAATDSFYLDDVHVRSVQ